MRIGVLALRIEFYGVFQCAHDHFSARQPGAVFVGCEFELREFWAGESSTPDRTDRFPVEKAPTQQRFKFGYTKWRKEVAQTQSDTNKTLCLGWILGLG